MDIDERGGPFLGGSRGRKEEGAQEERRHAKTAWDFGPFAHAENTSPSIPASP
ncbi:hypothetical protein ACVOMV_24315 [Mesorhizobium atlanticum]